MKQDCPSSTAYGVAMARAAHQNLDHPKVFDDPMALRVIGAQGVAQVQSRRWLQSTRMARIFRAFIVARSQFVEDELALAIGRGVRQYVVLGAGLDTFAYRNLYAKDNLRVYEVDYPATQAWKRKQLEAAGIVAPESLHFCPVDFETQDLFEVLIAAGFKPDEPSLFSWLGVTMYLRLETIIGTLKNIAVSSPRGTAVVFDYVTPLSTVGLFRRILLRLMMARLAARGEPWLKFIETPALMAELKALGFTQVGDLEQEDWNAR